MYKGLSIYDFCAFMIILGLIASIFLRNLWRFKKSRVFLVSLSSTIVAILFNAVFLGLTSMQLTPFTKTVAYVSKNIYFLILIVIVLFSYVYLLSTMGILNFYNRKINFYSINLLLLLCVPVIFVIISFPFKWIFSISSEVRYKQNFGHYFYYGWLILIYLNGIFIAIIKKQFLNKIKIIDCFVLYPINIGGLLFQILFPDSSFFMFVLAMSFYIISITTQRPEDFINPTLNVRSSTSYFKDTETLFMTKNSVFHIYVKILNHSQIKKYIGERSYFDFLRNVSDRIHAILNSTKSYADLYYLEDSEFCVVIEHDKKRYVNEISQRISELFDGEYDFESFKVYPDVRTCDVSIPTDINNVSYLFYFAKAFHHIVPTVKTPISYGSISQTTEFRIKNDIEHIIKNAIKTDRFDVFYHPVLNIKENKYDSVEALIRLTDEEYGEIPPSIFIPFAEINGFILEIGEIVFKKVLSFIKSDEFKNNELKYVQINLTFAQCMEKDFSQKVISLLEQYQVLPSQVQFEITEDIEENNVEIVKDNIKQLHEKGIVFALDDYGTGYSNIKQVLTLPIEIVKLDKSFVQEIDNDQMKIIIDGTINMLKNLGRKVLIEGIESKESLDYFKELQCRIEKTQIDIFACDYAQGYYLSKPLSINDLCKFLGK